MKVEIITADEMVFAGDADEVLLPSIGGGLGIKSGHTPLVVTLHAGDVTIIDSGKRQVVPILGGTASIAQSGLTVFATL